MKENRKLLLIFTVILISIFLPPFSSVPITANETMLLIRDVLIQTCIAYSWLSPGIHISTIILLIALYRYGQKVSRSFDAYFAILFVFIAFSNNIAITENYGLAVITGNLVPMLTVGLFWIWEVFRSRNEYIFHSLPAWRYWVVPFAILAFWFPTSSDLSPDFSPLLLITSSFGVMFCPTTPVAIALLTLIYPKVNVYVLSVTSFVGFLIGLFNTISLFIMPGYTLWSLILHTPLIFISIYGLIITRIVKKDS